MDAFRILLQGGVKFDKDRFSKDFQLFDKKSENNDDNKSNASSLDFFKISEQNKEDQNCSRKRSRTQSKAKDKEHKNEQKVKEESPNKLEHKKKKLKKDEQSVIEGF